jgi:glyoxylase-like metal-dependent hydrolase (beta-lactamase superfamily II)
VVGVAAPAGFDEMNQVVLPPSIHVLERGWLSSNNVVLHDDDEQATVVDTGYATQQAQTLALVQHALEGRRLTRIVNTHLHSDHCGGNALLKRMSGATLLIPPGHADAVARWDEDALTFRATGQKCDRFRHDGLIEPGARIRMGGLDWEVFGAPGHDPHSVVLWAAETGILISADALWNNGFGVIFPELEGESGFDEQRAVLRLIESLGPRLVIPGHGAPFTDVREALARAHTRLDALSSSLERNARHAAKVLLKFFLLEVRSISMNELIVHVAGARYYPLINDRYFRMPFDAFVRKLINELAAGGAVATDGDVVVNCDC